MLAKGAEVRSHKNVGIRSVWRCGDMSSQMETRGSLPLKGERKLRPAAGLSIYNGERVFDVLVSHKDPRHTEQSCSISRDSYVSIVPQRVALDVGCAAIRYLNRRYR